MNMVVFWSALALCGILAVAGTFACAMTSLTFDGYWSRAGWTLAFIAASVGEAAAIGMAWGSIV